MWSLALVSWAAAFAPPSLGRSFTLIAARNHKDAECDPLNRPVQDWSRRDVLMSAAVASQLLLSPAALAVDTGSDLEIGLLESRLASNVLNPPPYGMESPDVYYPSWFSGGIWKVKSATKDVQVI
jgi:hypothetical protein